MSKKKEKHRVEWIGKRLKGSGFIGPKYYSKFRYKNVEVAVGDFILVPSNASSPKNDVAKILELFEDDTYTGEPHRMKIQRLMWPKSLPTTYSWGEARVKGTPDFHDSLEVIEDTRDVSSDLSVKMALGKCTVITVASTEDVDRVVENNSLDEVPTFVCRYRLVSTAGRLSLHRAVVPSGWSTRRLKDVDIVADLDSDDVDSEADSSTSTDSDREIVPKCRGYSEGRGAGVKVVPKGQGYGERTGTGARVVPKHLMESGVGSSESDDGSSESDDEPLFPDRPKRKSDAISAPSVGLMTTVTETGKSPRKKAAVIVPELRVSVNRMTVDELRANVGYRTLADVLPGGGGEGSTAKKRKVEDDWQIVRQSARIGPSDVVHEEKRIVLPDGDFETLDTLTLRRSTPSKPPTRSESTAEPTVETTPVKPVERRRPRAVETRTGVESPAVRDEISEGASRRTEEGKDSTSGEEGSLEDSRASGQRARKKATPTKAMPAKGTPAKVTPTKAKPAKATPAKETDTDARTAKTPPRRQLRDRSTLNRPVVEVDAADSSDSATLGTGRRPARKTAETSDGESSRDPSPARTPARKSTRKENFATPKSSTKRSILVSTPQTPSSVKKTPKSVRVNLPTPTMPRRAGVPASTPGTPLEEARARLHVSAVPAALPCRDAEFDNVYGFLAGKIMDRAGGCMYISGVPGTGKTATVRQVVKTLQQDVNEGNLPAFNYVEINGMKMTEPRQAYVQILSALTDEKRTADQALRTLEKRFTQTKQKTTTLLVVDELDLICNKRQDVVYNLLDWPSKAGSLLVVVTIANTMDLPETMLKGRVTSRLGLTRLTFKPYNFKQLQEIVAARLAGLEAFDVDAVQLVARKVASISGDARRALDICRRATEIAESEENARPSTGTPGKKSREEAGASVLVTMRHVEAVMEEMVSSSKIRAISAGAAETRRGETEPGPRRGLKRPITDETGEVARKRSARSSLLPKAEVRLVRPEEATKRRPSGNGSTRKSDVRVRESRLEENVEEITEVSIKGRRSSKRLTTNSDIKVRDLRLKENVAETTEVSINGRRSSKRFTMHADIKVRDVQVEENIEETTEISSQRQRRRSIRTRVKSEVAREGVTVVERKDTLRSVTTSGRKPKAEPEDSSGTSQGSSGRTLRLRLPKTEVVTDGDRRTTLIQRRRTMHSMTVTVKQDTNEGKPTNKRWPKKRKPKRAKSSIVHANPLDRSDVVIEKILDNEPHEILSVVAKMSARLLGDDPELSDFYERRLALGRREAARLCVATAEQADDAWRDARRVRITASRCYSFYTHSQSKCQDWTYKLDGVLNPRRFFNFAMKNGVDNEDNARVAYAREADANVVRLGLIVNPAAPWLGCSPDGVVVRDGRPTKLLEIKCPMRGLERTARLVRENTAYYCSLRKGLKKRHPYYGQVQLGMALTGLKACDFVIYSSYDDTVAIEEIPYDEEFATEMITAVTRVYFQQMLPYLLDRLGDDDHTQDGKENVGLNATV